MKNVRSGFFIVAAVVVATMVAALPIQTTFASQITTRSLTLQAGAGGDGGSKAGGTVNHLFGFTIPTTASVGSMKFEYCTTASGTCTMPTGLVTTAATFGAETGATGFSITNTTNGSPYIKRGSASSITGGTAVTYRLDNITNPTANNTTFFVRISTYASLDTTGSPIDSGVVTASTAEQIVLSGTMPESLIFCTGATVPAVSSVPNCAGATSGVISFNQLFSPTDTATATSQMAASTNAGSGYVISVNGPTLTSGSNTIATMASATTSNKSTGQFGMNLKANTTSSASPAVGTEVSPSANGTNYKGQATAGYNTVDTFKYVSGDVVANSANGGNGPTDGQIFTVSYLVNVPGSQAAGSYTTTLTYICTATF